MFGLSSTAAGWLGAGLVVTVLGALVRFAGWTFLLAGYDASSAVPEPYVESVAGNSLLRVGLACVAVGALDAIVGTPSFLPAVVTAAILLVVGRMVYRLNTWSPPEAA